MKIYDISFNQLCTNIVIGQSNTCTQASTVSTISNEPTTLITNVGLTFPGRVAPLKPISTNEDNTVYGFNIVGMSEIDPCFGWACSDTLKICGNVEICKNLQVHGHTQLVDTSVNNLEVSGNLVVDGHSWLQDVSANNVDISGNLEVFGHTRVCDLSACNVDISQNLEVFGHTQLVDVSCATLQCDASSTVINGQSIVNNHPAVDWKPNASPPMAGQDFGMYMQAKNLYIDIINADADRGMIVSLSQNTSDSFFRVTKDFPSVPYLFEVGGDGKTHTQDILPFATLSYDIGSSSLPYAAGYFHTLFLSFISGNWTASGNAIFTGHLTFGDASGANLDLTNDLNVTGTMTSETWLHFADASGAKLQLSLGLEVVGITALQGHLAFVDASGEQLQLKEDLIMYYGPDFGNQLTLRSFPQASPGNYRVLDLSGGLAYFANNWAVNGGAASDNVGVVSIAHTNLNNALNQNVLQLSSAIVSGSYNSNMGILCCKNTSISDVLFKVDVGGRITAQTNRTGDSFMFKNTLTGATWIDSIIFLDSARGPIPPYYWDGTAGGGYSFLKCKKNGGVGSDVICQIDGDGSIKAKQSITVSATSATWPPSSGSYNLTLVPGTQSTITTRYSVFNPTIPGTALPGNPLRLQSAGNPAMGPGVFAYGNMVEIIPNTLVGGSGSYKTTGLKFKNATAVTGTENILWWTDNSDVADDESLYMIASPAGSTSGGFSSSRAIFEMKAGGSFTGSITPYIFRYYPEGRDSTSTVVNRFILGDDTPAGIIQMGAGKVGATGLTVATQGRLQANVVDCNAIDVTDINSGSNAIDLNIGMALTQNIQMDMGNSGKIDMGSGSDIICNAGSVRICAANHNSIIGTFGLLPSSGTGLRGFSSTTTVGIIGGLAAKLSVLKNMTPGMNPEFQFLTLSAIEGPQATILFRGQVQLDSHDARINVDSAIATIGSLPIPHTIPLPGITDPSGRGIPLGTFTTMFRFKNATVMVTNAGDPAGGGPLIPPFDMNFTRVTGSLSFSGTQQSQTVLHIRSDPAGTPNILVNYTIMVERMEPSTGPGTGYKNNPFTVENPPNSGEYYWNPSRTPNAMNEITGPNTWNNGGPINPP